MKARKVTATVTTPQTLADIRSAVASNRANGRETFAGLTSSDIGTYNRAVMFGDNSEAFPSDAAWSRIVD